MDKKEKIPTVEEMDEMIKRLSESGVITDPNWEEEFKKQGEEASVLLAQIRQRLKL